MSAPVEHPAAIDPAALLAQCAQRRVRRSGPGGQRRNKVETGAVLLHEPTGIVAEASERRSQAQNQAEALRRLRLELALTVRVARPPESVPSETWRSRLHADKIAINPQHADFPAVLAEALDVLADEEGDVRRAAERLAITPSQFVKLLKRDPRALGRVNQERRERGLAGWK